MENKFRGEASASFDTKYGAQKAVADSTMRTGLMGVYLYLRFHCCNELV